MKKIIALFIIFSVPNLNAAIGASTQWWIRTDGAETNGGGYDSTVANAGTNYSDQASTHVTFNGTSITGTTAGVSATITLTGYSPVLTDIGNVLRISGGTNFTTGYYVVLATGTATWVMDRNVASGVGAGMTGAMGGAWLDFRNIATGGSLPQPVIASPAVPGNIVNVRGSGSLDTNTTDYDMHSGYYIFTNGDPSTNGAIQMIGYNGRPMIATSGLFCFTCANIAFRHLKFQVNAATFFDYGQIGVGSTYNQGGSISDSIIDADGYDTAGVTGATVFNNEFRNTGVKTAGTNARGAINIASTYSGANNVLLIYGNYIHNWRGNGIDDSKQASGSLGEIARNLIVNSGLSGIYLAGTSYPDGIINNTIDGNLNDGITFASSLQAAAPIFGNIISNNGGYGLNISVNSTTTNNHINGNSFMGYNDYFNNTSGAYHNITGASTDLALNPTFTNSAGGNYSIGTNLQTQNFPGLFPGSSSTSYLDMGSVQHQCTGSGGTTIINQVNE